MDLTAAGECGLHFSVREKTQSQETLSLKHRKALIPEQCSLANKKEVSLPAVVQCCEESMEMERTP